MKNEKSLRGTEFNGLDWTVGGKQHKNAKRLLSTIDGTPNTKDKSKNQKIACDKCGATFNVRVKLPTHKRTYTKYIIDEVYYGQYGHIILIEDNTGEKINYLLRGDQDIIWFEDATSILRNNKLENLGI